MTTDFKRKLADVTAPADRDLIFEIVGQNYFNTFCEQRNLADDNETDLDTYQAHEDALEIDASLFPTAKKARVATIFDCTKFKLEAPDLAFHMQFKEGKTDTVRVTDTPGSYKEREEKIVVKLAPVGKSDGEEKMVSIMIDTGKGGKQQHWVPASCV